MSQRTDPLIGFHYVLDVGSHISGAVFTSLSGMGSESEVVEYKVNSGQASDFTGSVFKQVGRLKWEDITLKRGIGSGTMEVWQWRHLVETGGIDSARANGTITLYDEKGTVAAVFNFFRAWPKKVSVPEIKSDSNEVLLEELVICTEGFERVQ